MKKNAILSMTIAILSVAVISTGCEHLPQIEMDAANAAVDSVKLSGAEVYLPGQFAMLQDSMTAAKENIELQKSKTFPSYAASKQKLTNVKAMANALMAEVEVKKTEVKNSISATLDETRTTLQENKKMIAKAPKGKEGSATMETMKQELKMIEISVNEASDMLNNSQEYMTILDKANTARVKAGSMNAELKEVMAKFAMNSKTKKA